MAHIDLDRKFVEWTANQQPSFQHWQVMKREKSSLGWKDILAAKRAIILAEGGAGKSEELKEQSRILQSRKQFSFFLTVKKAGENGVDSSLTAVQRNQLKAWRSSDQPAWFFLDSIDEAKGTFVSLGDALERLAETIDGAGFRAHVIFSCRPSEWEFRKDLALLIDILPSSELPSDLDPINVDEHIIQAFRKKKQKAKTQPAGPLVAFMAPLDERQIKVFAKTLSISDMAEFWAALAEFDLWSFASRPLDLSWLVRYWRSHQKFDKLERMLRVNLVERLRETDSERARKFKIDSDTAMKCLERVGAALALSQQRDIAIPDGGIYTSPSDALRLNEILNDLAPEKLADFANTAIFVASSPGVVRLHNDNDGVIRSYLAAQWMARALRNHCPWRVVREMLFVKSHGLLVAKPSMLSTAVWLSLWDARASKELSEIQPFALLDSGDPSSLPLGTRRKVLRAVVTALDAGHRQNFFSFECLKRFAQADLESDINELWTQCGGESRSLLLQLIREGKLRGCAALAFDAATSVSEEWVVRSLAAQAIHRAGDDAMRSRFADWLRQQASTMEPVVLWNAVELYSPKWFAVDDVIAALPTLLSNKSAVGESIDYYGPSLAKRLDKVEEATALLAALLNELPARVDHTYENVDFDQLSPVMGTTAELAMRILDLDGSPEAVQAAIDALLRLTAIGREPDWRADAVRALGDRMRQTAALRKAALWRFAETFETIAWTPGTPLTHPWQLNAARLSLGLSLNDVDWLLNDVANRDNPNDKLLALNLTMSIWRQEAEPATLLRRVEDCAGESDVLSRAIGLWQMPRERLPEQIRMDEDHAKHSALNKERQRREDASWVQFAAEIRNDPNQLNSLIPPGPEGVDARIFHLWQLLDRLGGSAQNHSISDVSLLTPAFGARALPYVQDAFLRYWRLGSPTLRGERPTDLASSGNAMESIGLVGLSMESTQKADWAKSLSPGEARLAAIYASLELNGFPPWFEQLASEQPKAVRDILERVLTPELTQEKPGEWLDMLERVVRSPEPILRLSAPMVFDRIASSLPTSSKAFSLALRIVISAQHRLTEVLGLMLAWAAQEKDTSRLAIYLSSAFAIDGDATTQALARIRERLSPVDKGALAEALLPAIFGGALGTNPAGLRLAAISTESLIDLIAFAFETFPLDKDRERPSGQAYSPDGRDHAQRARNASINLLAERPGLATFDALRHLAGLPAFATISEWLNELAVMRARLDAESAPWTPHDVSEFELDFQTVPRTAADLQRVAAAKIEDLQHDLIHGDFGQRRIVARFERELDAQRWLAHELNLKSGRSYSVVREPHVADEKEPDITLTSSGTGAKVPIEIKIAETWSLPQLEVALTEQLKDRYLRDPNAQWGILLLIHCKRRPHGWRGPSGGFLSFDEVILNLRALGARISASDPAGPQMQVCAIDVATGEAGDDQENP